jgi:hypothetical protein
MYVYQSRRQSTQHRPHEAKDGANHICANANGKLNNDGNACTVLGRITL